MLDRSLLPATLATLLATAAGCYSLRPSAGAGQADFSPPRQPRAEAVAVPPGYRVELVATGLTFPTGVDLDDAGRIHVVESGYSYGEDFTTPRLLRIEPDGRITPIATGGRSGPWTGVTHHRGNFLVADGNVLEGGRLLRISPAGRIDVLVSGMPSLGDHHTNGPVAGPDGWIYFSQGTATNAGVVGRDNFDFGWLARHRQFHDVPGADITLSGESFTGENPLAGGEGRVTTGAFSPFATPGRPGQVIRGTVKCSGGLLRVRPEGGEPELVAWGFRNPFGIAFAPDGALYVTDNGYDDRGSRPVWGAPDVLWRIEPGLWYGWPDFAGGLPLTDSRFRPPGKRSPGFLLARHPNPPPQPIARMAVHSSANGFDFSRNARFGHEGEAFVAIFGDQAPTVGKILGPVGGKVVRVNVRTGVITDFAVNRASESGPASRVGVAGLERPIAARFNRDGTALYVVDFGVLLMSPGGAEPKRETGVLWRITRNQ